jgi:2-polyprenyl-3-methyl-5-hydroxy-6-metoxy-1,4-benzoquinol methylase
MTVRIDPEENEIRALVNMAEFSGKHVLEIGCGNGRLTWRYAPLAAHVTAIDPFLEGITKARENLPDDLHSRVEFHPIAFDDFAATKESATYDLAILSWSLC